jgi:hypothetical protein
MLPIQKICGSSETVEFKQRRSHDIGVTLGIRSKQILNVTTVYGIFIN